jgi:hypothetical protein
MARKVLTDEQRADRAARLDLLGAAAAALELSTPADIDLALLMLGKYSRRNVAMICAQALERGRDIPQAVAGFHEWRAAGRIVRKGSKGYAIYAPIMKRDKAAGVDSDAHRVGYTVRYVFDVLDTDVLAADSPTLARDMDTVPA